MQEEQTCARSRGVIHKHNRNSKCQKLRVRISTGQTSTEQVLLSPMKQTASHEFEARPMKTKKTSGPKKYITSFSLTQKPI